MIQGIACSEKMTEALLGLPEATLGRVEAALAEAFRSPQAVQQYANVTYEQLEIHIIVSEDVLFLLGENRARIELLRVMLFQPETRTLH
jgi:ABC-type uncharacterized transport system YnjBCD ATPase subunit